MARLPVPSRARDHSQQPTAFNDPANLALWSDGPRIAACFTELVEGLQFSAHQGTASLHHVKVGKRGCQQRTLLDLTAPGLPLLQGQMELVAAYADLRGDRGAEILAQMGLPVPFWAAITGILDHRQKKTLQLMALAFALANHVEMRFKQMFAIVRPVELSPQIQPMIPTPGHGAYPSGHATEAFTVATLLNALLRAARPGKAHASEGTRPPSCNCNDRPTASRSTARWPACTTRWTLLPAGCWAPARRVPGGTLRGRLPQTARIPGQRLRGPGQVGARL